MWDEDGDGTFESREVFAQPWVGDNYHHFSFGLVEHEDWIYGTLSTAIYFNNTIKADQVEGSVVSMNGPNPQNRGAVYRIHAKSREIEYIAGGFRTPNGIGVSTDGEVYVADNLARLAPHEQVGACATKRVLRALQWVWLPSCYPEGDTPAGTSATGNRLRRSGFPRMKSQIRRPRRWKFMMALLPGNSSWAN